VAAFGTRPAQHDRRMVVDQPATDDPGRSDRRTPEASGLAPSFLELYHENFAAMVKLAVLLTGSEASAEDLVHDSFIRVHGRWQHIEHPQAYLRRTVVNACRSAARRARRERARAVPSTTTTPFAADEMFDVLGTLPHRQRAALILQFYEGLSQAEIAEVLGCREGTVASLVHRGLSQLRRMVERE
jgi:RNA polymerase sigma-70 factor (sigma-E family)